MLEAPYRFERRGRRPGLWLAIGAGFGFVIVGLVKGDFWLAALGLAFPIPFLAFERLMGMPAGVMIGDGKLGWWRGTEQGAAPLAVIRRAIVNGSRVSLIFEDGTTIDLPEASVPPGTELGAELALRGVPVSAE